MSSGQASHKGTSNKINVNASGQINTDPQEALLEDESPRAGREEEGKHIPAATERAARPSEETSSQEVHQYEQPKEGSPRLNSARLSPALLVFKTGRERLPSSGSSVIWCLSNIPFQTAIL
ncbi:hypothetical protein IQ238_24825, partial [Pleurocapsales cyanobacterium LEGE 06147]|nr:hypothetical protein [Pleurocapsales cyanobacterium LEGE 06147]